MVDGSERPPQQARGGASSRIVEQVDPRPSSWRTSRRSLSTTAGQDFPQRPSSTRGSSSGSSLASTCLNAADFGVPQRESACFSSAYAGVRASMRNLSLTRALCRPTFRDALDTSSPYGVPGNDTLCSAIDHHRQVPCTPTLPVGGMLFNGAGRPMDLDRPAPTLPASMGGNRHRSWTSAQLESEERDHEPWVVRYHAHLWDGARRGARCPRSACGFTVVEGRSDPDLPGADGRAGAERAIPPDRDAVPPELAYRVALAVRESLGLQGLGASGTRRTCKQPALAGLPEAGLAFDTLIEASRQRATAKRSPAIRTEAGAPRARKLRRPRHGVAAGRSRACDRNAKTRWRVSSAKVG